MSSVTVINTHRDALPNAEVVTRRLHLVKPVSGLDLKDSDEELLLKIDSIWRKDTLFSKSNNPEDDFYYEYLSDLQLIADENKDYFSGILNPVTGNKKTNLFKEFTNLCNNPDLNAFQRAICATQALELTLLGANPTGVLRSINKASGWDGTKGFRNELLAGWFLAKFIYKSSPELLSNFTHSESLPTIHSYRAEKVIKLPAYFAHEIDINTSDALVSVKSGSNNFSEQICNLFFAVIDNQAINGANLKNKIRKLVLIKTAEKPEQLLPTYKHKPEYWELKEKIITDVRRKFEELYPPETQPADFQECYKRLISNHGISIYYLPHIEDERDKVPGKDWITDFQAWLKNNYAELDRTNSFQQTA